MSGKGASNRSCNPSKKSTGAPVAKGAMSATPFHNLKNAVPPAGAGQTPAMLVSVNTPSTLRSALAVKAMTQTPSAGSKRSASR